MNPGGDLSSGDENACCLAAFLIDRPGRDIDLQHRGCNPKPSQFKGPFLNSATKALCRITSSIHSDYIRMIISLRNLSEFVKYLPKFK